MYEEDRDRGRSDEAESQGTTKTWKRPGTNSLKNSREPPAQHAPERQML